MSQPPQGEEPQHPRPPAPGWGWQPPQEQPGQADGSGPPSGAQGAGWGQQAGQYGSQYGQQPGYGQQAPYGHDAGYGQQGPYGQPGQYGAPGGSGQYGPYSPHPGHPGQPGQYGAPYGGQYAQPTGYGQFPGWGQPAQPAPRKSRVPRIIGLVVLAVLVVGAAIILPVTLGSTRLDPQAVQRDVAAQYEQREGVPIELSCDQRMAVQDGKSYQCAGTTPDGEQLTITITITSPEGDYTWADR